MKKVKNIFWVFTVLFLMTQRALAMWEEEDSNTVSHLTRAPLESTIITREINYEFPEEILTQVFALFDLDDFGRFIQTSSRWQKAGSNPQLCVVDTHQTGQVLKAPKI